MEYDEEFLKKIVQMGTLGYPLSKIVNVLDIENIDQFTQDFDNKKSKVFVSYKKGVDKADFIIDSKLFEMAKSGDLKALDQYSKRKRIQLYAGENEKGKR